MNEHFDFRDLNTRIILLLHANNDDSNIIHFTWNINNFFFTIYSVFHFFGSGFMDVEKVNVGAVRGMRIIFSRRKKILS